MAVPDVQEILRLLEEGREVDAVARLEEAVPRESTNPSIRVLLARAYEKIGRLGDAMEAWTAALFLAPESSAASAGVRRLRRSYPDLKPAEPGTAEAGGTVDAAPPAIEQHADTLRTDEPASTFVRAVPPEPAVAPESAGQAEPASTPDAAGPARSASIAEPARASESPSIPDTARPTEPAATPDPARAAEPAATPDPARPTESQESLSEPARREEPVEPAKSAGPVADAAREENLDLLIEQLQGARIVPNPDFEAEEVDLSDDDDDDGLVSETLARIYAAQQQYREAAQVYEVLATQQPERADEFRLKAREMKMRGSG